MGPCETVCTTASKPLHSVLKKCCIGEKMRSISSQIVGQTTKRVLKLIPPMPIDQEARKKRKGKNQKIQNNTKKRDWQVDQDLTEGIDKRTLYFV